MAKSEFVDTPDYVWVDLPDTEWQDFEDDEATVVVRLANPIAVNVTEEYEAILL